MQTINELKELAATDTPLLLFDCELANGTVERWSTHRVAFGGNVYEPRVVRHDLFEIRSGSDDGIDAMARVSLWLADADSRFSEIERATGFKGSRVTVQLLFYDLRNGAPASEARVIFKGRADSPAEITESTLRLPVMNSLNLQRVLLPEVRIERRCPWRFPSTNAQRAEAAQGGAQGKYSPFYRCGYSAGAQGGAGNPQSGVAYTACDRTRAQCTARGMFRQDSAGAPTRRFGGVEFVPPTTIVRSYGEKGQHVSQALANEARYNDFVPLVYGTAWYKPPIIFSKNDGNLTRMEVLLGMGEMTGIIKLLVNDVDIPLGQAGKNMTATGWYNPVTMGQRTGGFNPDYVDAAGAPLGDPYGSMAVLSVVVPNRVNDGRSLPEIQVLAQGLKVERFAADGASLGEAFTNNSAWVLLDVVRRCGWAPDEIDLPSFACSAAVCDELITAEDLHGNTADIPRFQCNLVLRTRRTAADVIRGIRNGARLYLTHGNSGLLELHAENTLALEQPVKPDGSNAASAVNGGWPAYEFGDGTSGISGILRKGNGESSLRLRTESAAATPNRLSVEFQDAFNEYQQDSLSAVDAEEALRLGQEVSLSSPVLGLPNFNQAARIVRFNLDKAIAGNVYVDFETTVKGAGLKPGDLITLTYLKEGFDRQPFRVCGLAPGTNYRSVQVTAQIHQDPWYDDHNADVYGNTHPGRQQGYGIGLPRPVAGTIRDAHGDAQLGITEKSNADAGGTIRVTLAVDFQPPRQPAVSGLGIPIVSLAAEPDSTGGTLAGDQTLYYAVTEGDASGQESSISFIVRATVPPGTNTNTVTLTGLSFTADAACFHVYRGATPEELLRIAANLPVVGQFTDTGLDQQLAPAPDENYDHANLYWRLEEQPENDATIFGAQTAGNANLGMAPNAWRGMVARITRGTGAGQERTITANDATTLTVATAWNPEPDGSSGFVVAEAGWHAGASGSCGPLEFELPGRPGATVHVCARAANVYERECAYELSPLTRWRITGGGTASDADVPGKPVFGLTTRHQGDVELGGIGFQDLTNTRTISSGTLTLYYWNELASPSGIVLASSASATDSTLSFSHPLAAGDLIQVDGEIIRIEQVTNGGLQGTVTRGIHGSQAAAHNNVPAAPVYRLSSSVAVAPFAADFFGSPASGNFLYTVALPGARIASAELFMTNARGSSTTAAACFTGTTDGGLRTISGGQFSIQIEGYLAVETSAAPPLVIENTQAVRDICAVVTEPPVGGNVEMDVLQDGTPYCHLIIPPGPGGTSNVANGFGLPPLTAGSRVTLNITSVPQATGTKPGRDLTVTIRV